MAALGRREGCGGRACLGVDGSHACLALPVGSRRFVEGHGGFLKLRAGGGGVTAQGGELGAKRKCQTFVLGGGQFDRVAIGGGLGDVLSTHPGAGEAFLHIVNGDPLHFGLLRRLEAGPDGGWVP